MNFKRTLTYWFPKTLGVILLTAQLYKYLAGRMTDYLEEGFITVIGVSFFINIKWILEVVKQYFTKNEDRARDNEE